MFCQTKVSETRRYLQRSPPSFLFIAREQASFLNEELRAGFPRYSRSLTADTRCSRSTMDHPADLTRGTPKVAMLGCQNCELGCLTLHDASVCSYLRFGELSLRCLNRPPKKGRDRKDKDRANGSGKTPESYSENHRKAPNGQKWNAAECDLGN